MKDELNALRSGAYWVAQGAIGTAIVGQTGTSFSATAALLTISNARNPAAGLKAPDCIPDYIRLVCTAAGTGSTSVELALVLDTVERYSSGGTQLTAYQTNSAEDSTKLAGAPALGVNVWAGAVTAGAASAARLIGRAKAKTQAAPCLVVGDQFLITFGQVGIPISGLSSGSAASIYTVQFSPVLIAGRPTTHTLVLHMWMPSNSGAPSFEVEVGGRFQL